MSNINWYNQIIEDVAGTLTWEGVTYNIIQTINKQGVRSYWLDKGLRVEHQYPDISYNSFGGQVFNLSNHFVDTNVASSDHGYLYSSLLTFVLRDYEFRSIIPNECEIVEARVFEELLNNVTDSQASKLNFTYNGNSATHWLSDLRKTDITILSVGYRKYQLRKAISSYIGGSPPVIDFEFPYKTIFHNVGIGIPENPYTHLNEVWHPAIDGSISEWYNEWNAETNGAALVYSNTFDPWCDTCGQDHLFVAILKALIPVLLTGIINFGYNYGVIRWAELRCKIKESEVPIGFRDYSTKVITDPIFFGSGY